MIIGVSGLKNVLDGIEDLSKIDLRPVIKSATQVVQEEAKELAPYDTGYLFRGIHRKTTGRGTEVVGRVYNKVEYAIYQEFGFTVKNKAGQLKFVPPTPHMRPALEKHRTDINNFARKYLEKQVKESMK